MSQVDSIFIFGDDKTYHESWVKQWPKIKGVFTNIKHILGILFVINIDPSKSNTPFASIIDVSYFKSGEEEVIFSMHTVFRINDIQAMDKHDRLFRVNLILTDDDDLELRVLTDRIREESAGTGWYRLGSLLRKMGQFDKSEQVYEIMLEQTTEESDEAPIYLQIGSAKFTQGQY
ncbi:hypothetical protein I4U23_005705 [Adineta vaga]|nr:hypothetical protein I4U23_005705 [Adineta vaga]